MYLQTDQRPRDHIIYKCVLSVAIRGSEEHKSTTGVPAKINCRLYFIFSERVSSNMSSNLGSGRSFWLALHPLPTGGASRPGSWRHNPDISLNHGPSQRVFLKWKFLPKGPYLLVYDDCIAHQLWRLASFCRLHTYSYLPPHVPTAPSPRPPTYKRTSTIK
ncbi:hypothetical protein J6590_011379 [Homalodisca vitripennis]|nr:hypothetical protein J6590_011379 [Homalodisca vitripennis]